MSSYLSSVIKQFEYYKSLADKTFDQLSFSELNQTFQSEDNSIAIIAKHLAGNMLSRWTNFLEEDGEKSWRHRDSEFINDFESNETLISYWEKGWNCLFHTLNNLSETQLEDTIYIRNQGHTVTEAINRQMIHYAYHVGQMVFIGKSIKGTDWQSLSIPKGNSEIYNSKKFGKSKARRHFTEDL
ncbi:DUF1572 family protein [Winogradskyella maritima]|uniref:DUF1572 family protein n=1 Tax=Winogradskyella maritima TaxID=1517766 RepID=A0ABV8AKS5_9FLAO|nr:DUF1572 family protein [Winogradskyella maritima]